jgi:phosphatidylserine decarboxylase
MDGELKEMIHIPGNLFSVNPKFTKNIMNIFTKNERLLCIFKTKIGDIVIIFIGSFLVGSINTIWHGTIHTKKLKNIEKWNYNSHQYFYKKGEEIGQFTFGSTIINIYPKIKSFKWKNTLKQGMPIQLNQTIATII